MEIRKSTQQSAFGIQPAQQLGVVSTGILPSKVTVDLHGCEPVATIRLFCSDEGSHEAQGKPKDPP
jgi:hypothetical protein